MLVSTAVVSVRNFFPAMRAASVACSTIRWWICWVPCLPKREKSPTQIAKVWNRVLIKACEATIEKAGSQFAVQLTIRPTFNVLEHHTAQQPIGSNPLAANFVGAGRAARQSLNAQSQQSRVFKQRINWIEHRVTDRGCFFKEGESKQRGLANSFTDHYLIDILD